MKLIHLKKHNYIFFVGTFILLIFLKWYHLDYYDHILEIHREDISGWETISTSICIGLGYILCLIVQCVVFKIKKYYFTASVLQVVLLSLMIVFPFYKIGIDIFARNTKVLRAFYYSVKMGYVKYEYGFYISCICIIGFIVINIIQCTKNKKFN